MPWWAWMLVGAGAILLIEGISVAIFAYCLGQEVYQEN